MKSFSILTLAFFAFVATPSLRADDAKADMAKKMAATHRAAAECIEKGTAIAECEEAFHKACDEHCKNGGECFMKGKHHHHGGAKDEKKS